jgi:hypothetical protein
VGRSQADDGRYDLERDLDWGIEWPVSEACLGKLK